MTLSLPKPTATPNGDYCDRVWSASAALCFWRHIFVDFLHACFVSSGCCWEPLVRLSFFYVDFPMLATAMHIKTVRRAEQSVNMAQQ
jgi:hypothetical protein